MPLKRGKVNKKNGSFSAERRSPRVSTCDALICAPRRKPLCGLSQRKNSSFLNAHKLSSTMYFDPTCRMSYKCFRYEPGLSLYSGECQLVHGQNYGVDMKERDYVTLH